MAEKFVADCQYNDFQGSIAIDENSAGEGQQHLLDEMATRANVPEGYSAVGFQLHGVKLDENLEPMSILPITLVTIKEDEIGYKEEEMEEYGRKYGNIPLYRFELEMNVIELLTFFKRLDIKILVRDWQRFPFEVQ